MQRREWSHHRNAPRAFYLRGGRPVCRPPFLKIALSRTAFDTEKNAPAPKWFPADWFFRRAIARLSPSDVLARAAAARLRECGKSKKIDTTRKEVYKNFVDICLTDFCYPRA
ncbi:hypothetical protein NKH49_24095 [Mesorhizobium sp. M1088]|uniref:hypothetical protein n=1 Tax=Mesorhizobium sp. M1088 TaxID=2957056 RepID=UPI003337DBB4